MALAKYISDVLWMEEDIVIIRRGMRGEKHIDRFCFMENTIWKLRIGAVWRIFWYAFKECTVFKGNVFFNAYFVIEKGIKIGSNFAVYTLMTCIF